MFGILVRRRRGRSVPTVGDLIDCLPDKEKGRNIGKVITLQVEILSKRHDTSVLPEQTCQRLGFMER